MGAEPSPPHAAKGAREEHGHQNALPSNNLHAGSSDSHGTVIHEMDHDEDRDNNSDDEHRRLIPRLPSSLFTSATSGYKPLVNLEADHHHEESLNDMHLTTQHTSSFSTSHTNLIGARIAEEAAEADIASPTNVRTCRICFESSDDDLDAGHLISPCLCKGSSQYIHLGCLEQWRTKSTRKDSYYRCDTCHYHYSFSRPWIAHVLGHPLFLHIITLLMFLTLCYAAAWGGRELDMSGAWKWKKMFGRESNVPTFTFLGLDALDYLWGLSVLAIIGLLGMIIFGVVYSCTCCGRSGRGGGGGGGFFYPMYFGSWGSGGGDSGGGEVICAIFLVAILIIGTIGALWMIYMTMAHFTSNALESMKETILEVKKK